MSDERKRAILDQALKDKALLAEVPAVVGLSFGVLPIEKRGGVLTVACFAHANRDALRVLRDVLSLEIVAIAVEERPLQTALQKAYQSDEDRSPNFPTFPDPDFLERREIAAALRREKVEQLGKTGSELEAGTVALACWTYRSCLWNLDHARDGGALPDTRVTKYDLRDQDLVWSHDGGEPVVWTKPTEPPVLDARTVLLVNEYRLSDHRHVAPGSLFADHRVLGTALAASELPYVIHPTEVQLARIERTGALVFHAYNREERVAPRAPREFRCAYHFLSFGNRLRREIVIAVHELDTVSRDALVVRPGRARWTPSELERWFASPPARPSLAP